MSEVIYTYQHEIFTLKVTGKNAGRYQAYCHRIGVAEGTEESLVEEAPLKVKKAKSTKANKNQQIRSKD